MQLQQKVYIATYESSEQEWDDKLGDYVYKSFTEYYIEGENGLEKIGEKGNDTLWIETENVFYDESDNIDIEKGSQIGEVTQYEMQDRLNRSKMRESLDIGDVTEIAEIQDCDFLKDFYKQCGQEYNPYEPYNKIYIVSSLNEQGEQDFNIVYGNGDNFIQLDGIEATGNSNRSIDIPLGNGAPGSGIGQMFTKTKSLKEFITNDGHRYAITRNNDGTLGFNGIYKENEHEVKAAPIKGMYEYWKKDLIDNYKKAGINQEDLDNAYKNIDNSREKEEQNQEQSNDDLDDDFDL